MKKGSYIYAKHKIIPNVSFLGIITEIDNNYVLINEEYLFIKDYNIEDLSK